MHCEFLPENVSKSGRLGSREASVVTENLAAENFGANLVPLGSHLNS